MPDGWFVDEPVPVGTAAVVLLEHVDGALLARYAERRDAVPAPRRHVVDALLRLALELAEQADALDAETRGHRG